MLGKPQPKQKICAVQRNRGGGYPIVASQGCRGTGQHHAHLPPHSVPHVRSRYAAGQTHARPRKAADQTASCRNEKEDVVKGSIVLFATVLTISQILPAHFFFPVAAADQS